MGSWAAKVIQDGLVGAAGLFQRVGQDRHTQGDHDHDALLRRTTRILRRHRPARQEAAPVPPRHQRQGRQGRQRRRHPDAFLAAIAPFRHDLVVGCECLFAWYWLADLCQTEKVSLLVGPAYSMRLIHGAKAKNDKIDAHKPEAPAKGTASFAGASGL
jgi:hypothetical protein